MRKIRIKAEYIKSYNTTIAKSNFSNELKNIFINSFLLRKQMVCSSDITYIWTYDGFVYLTIIMDFYSKKAYPLDNAWVEYFPLLIKI